MSAPVPGAPLARLAVVAIGRNEGPRLRRCLESIPRGVAARIYVDSGSSDGSPALARALGAEVVELDPSLPFSAARARNAGFERAIALAAELLAVQFVDGDCSLAPGFLERALALLAAERELGAVCGRRREIAPERTIYNRICDVEWRSPPAGDVGSIGFGGDVMIRVEALREAGGYRESLIAGEDPELSLRLRWLGWKVERRDLPMTLHDVDMRHFGQWWRRARRAGHAWAEVAHLHRGRAERIFRRELRRIAVWGGALPLGALATAPLEPIVSWLLLSLYPLQIARVAAGAIRQGFGYRDAAAWGLACVGGALPNLVGAAGFHWNRLQGRRTPLIEYRGPGAPQGDLGGEPGSDGSGR